MKVTIKCKGSHTALLNDLKIIQGDLKQLSEKSYLKLKQQIIDEGFIAPFFVWNNDGELNLLDGTQRKLTLVKMREEGIELPDHFPIVMVEADNYKQACKRILALSSQYGSITKDTLKRFMDRADISFNEVEDEYEFDAIDFDEFKDEFEDKGDEESDPSDDEVPEVEESCYVLEGDLWTLGEHKILCGDSTSRDRLDLLLSNQKFDLYCDPPYGVKLVNNDGGYERMSDSLGGYGVNGVCKRGSYKKIIGDDNTEIAIKFISNLKYINYKNCFIWGANYYSSQLPDFASWLVWDKENGEGFFADGELCWTNTEKTLRIFRHQWKGMIKASEMGEKRVHPSQKPIQLHSEIFEHYNVNDFVCDLFLGSGSTLIACQKTNRKCYGMEIDPHYVQVIIERYITYMQKENKEYSIQCERGDQTYSLDQIKSMV